MSELKQVVILNGEIINVGEWDYQEYQVIINQLEIDNANQYNANIENESERVDVPEPIFETKQRNPMPIGSTMEQREMIKTDEHGWREINWTPPMKPEEKMLELEKENEQLAQTLDSILTDLIPSLLGGN